MVFQLLNSPYYYCPPDDVTQNLLLLTNNTIFMSFIIILSAGQSYEVIATGLGKRVYRLPKKNWGHFDSNLNHP